MSSSHVTIASFANLYEAQMARERLAAHDIEAFVADEHLASLQTPYLGASGGIRVQVAQTEAARAVEVLSHRVDEAEFAETPDEAIDGPACPQCREHYAYLERPFWVWWLGPLLLGIPLLFVSKRWQCRRCGHHWPTSAPVSPAAMPYRELAPRR